MANENNKYQKAKVGEYGDVICPNCLVNIITPKGHFLRAGEYACSCGIIFEVTKEVIDEIEKGESTGTDTAG